MLQNSFDSQVAEKIGLMGAVMVNSFTVGMTFHGIAGEMEVINGITYYPMKTEWLRKEFWWAPEHEVRQTLFILIRNGWITKTEDLKEDDPNLYGIRFTKKFIETFGEA